MFYVAYRTLLVMFCVLKFYFVDYYGMFTSSPTWRLKMHVLCKVGKNIIFQNKTLLIMFYRHNKTFWYQFCNFKHFLKAENSEDSLVSSYRVLYWSVIRSNSTSDRTLALPVQRYTTGHWLTLPRRSQTCHQYFCSQKMFKITLMLPQLSLLLVEHHLTCFVM